MVESNQNDLAVYLDQAALRIREDFMRRAEEAFSNPKRKKSLAARFPLGFQIDEKNGCQVHLFFDGTIHYVEQDHDLGEIDTRDYITHWIKAESIVGANFKQERY